MVDAEGSPSLSPASPPKPKDTQTKGTNKRRAGRKKFRETRHPVYRGVRARAGGSRWVCEVREPQAQARIWLGTYPTPEMAARAHDVAAIALRGALAADLNFPESAHALPRPRSAAPDDIRCAAAQAAELYRPSSASSAAHQQIIAAPPPPPDLMPQASSTTATACWAAAAAGTVAAAAATRTTTPALFVDEDAIFDMPGLIDDMARGMLLTPPPMTIHQYWQGQWQWQGAAALADDDDGHVDCTLWMD